MILLPKDSIFIAGVPVTGKTYFGDWLEKHHNYLHLDFEMDDSIRKHNLQKEHKRIQNDGFDPLFQVLEKTGKSIVFNWGFIPQNLPIIQQILKYGLNPVWLTASKKIAREKFIERGGIDVKYFDLQMQRIEEMQHQLSNVFALCEVKSLRDDGTRMKPEEIYDQIQQTYGV